MYNLTKIKRRFIIITVAPLEIWICGLVGFYKGIMDGARNVIDYWHTED